jgi:lysophospholipase L1-like esterase
MATGTKEPMTDRRPGEPDHVDGSPRRRAMPAGRVLVTILVGLLVWGLLYAPELKRSSEAQPDGIRRTVSLDVLGPIVAIEDRLGLTGVLDDASSALGRQPNEAVGGGGDVDPLPPMVPPVGGDEPTRQPHRDTKLRTPTAANPLRVVVVGDSLAQGIGTFAERVFRPNLVQVFRQGRISTGLSRPDYFNWPWQMRQIVQRARPDLTIVMLGENDGQSLVDASGNPVAQTGTTEFPLAYAERVRGFAKIATSEGGHVIWVGLPQPRDTRRWDFIGRQNEAFAQAAAELPNVAYFDTWNTFAAPDGGYTAYYRDGSHVSLVRADDGVHFNADGYTILMRLVADFAGQQFQLDPKTYED